MSNRAGKKLHRISEKSDGTVPYESEELKKYVKVPSFVIVQFFVQMVSANQDSKLKRTAISLIHEFLFSISKKNFWFQRTLAFFVICQEFWMKGGFLTE